MATAASQGSASLLEQRPVLHLSGPKLTASLETLIKAAEAQGGIEAFAKALKLKAKLFQDVLADGKARTMDEAGFERLFAYMATVRRRVSSALEELGYARVRDVVGDLVAEAADTAAVDGKIEAFVSAFPPEKSYRWTRDLAAEILHNLLPEQYPLMTKWVWDARANTGVLREIWYGDNVDHMIIDVPDRYATFVVLREEISQFLADNGVFRDMLQYVDLLQAQVYGEYINSQGGVYLRTDFTSVDDPLEHVRRILGLDGVSTKAGRSRYKTIDGKNRASDSPKQLS